MWAHTEPDRGFLVRCADALYCRISSCASENGGPGDGGRGNHETPRTTIRLESHWRSSFWAHRRCSTPGTSGGSTPGRCGTPSGTSRRSAPLAAATGRPACAACIWTPFSRGSHTNTRDAGLLCPRHHARAHDPAYRHTGIPTGVSASTAGREPPGDGQMDADRGGTVVPDGHCVPALRARPSARGRHGDPKVEASAGAVAG